MDQAKIAVTCLRSWVDGDFGITRAQLADDVVFTGPLGHTEGADAYLEGIRGMSKAVQRVDISQVVAEGDNVCVIYELVTHDHWALPTVGWYRFRDGLVVSIRAYFDPRPLVS